MEELRLSDKDLIRFWSKVSLPNKGGCMLWNRATTDGYGQIYLNSKLHYAHRVSLILATGKNHPELDAAHGCWNRRCVAPNHLRWATRAENQQDRLRDGTDNRGEKHPLAKLDYDKVEQIRSMYASGGFTLRGLGEQFGISHVQVRNVIKNKAWQNNANINSPTNERNQLC